MPVCDSSQGIVEVYITFNGCTGGRWENGGPVRAGDYFFYGKGNENHQSGTGILYTIELYQQLREKSLLVKSCHIYSDR
jgi:hypothetical protein